jgi:hypothetical protein
MVLYICRECGRQISSGAIRCPYCGAPPRPPLSGRPWSHRLALRAALVLVLALPILMLPVVLRWRYGSWNPCDWLVQEGTTTTLAAPSTDDLTYGQCFRRWAGRIGG